MQNTEPERKIKTRIHKMKPLYKPLILRVRVADVKGDGVKEVSTTADTCEPIVEFEDGDYVLFSWKELIKQAIEFKRQWKKNEKQ
jgi:hypothetical protein